MCERMDQSACGCDAAPMPPKKLSPDPALGRAVRKLREARGLTQEELASQAGMTFGTVSRLESGKSVPAWATVMQILAALGVSLHELAAAIDAES